MAGIDLAPARTVLRILLIVHIVMTGLFLLAVIVLIVLAVVFFREASASPEFLLSMALVALSAFLSLLACGLGLYALQRSGTPPRPGSPLPGWHSNRPR